MRLQQKPLSEIINGISLSTFGTECDCITNGLSTGLIGQLNFQVNGISSSLFMNFAQRHNGLQLALYNEAYYMSGVQIGLSSSGVHTKGLQIGVIENHGEITKGVQIGLINKSNNLKGIQIGLWNVNQKRKLPLINWNFDQKAE